MACPVPGSRRNRRNMCVHLDLCGLRVQLRVPCHRVAFPEIWYGRHLLVFRIARFMVFRMGWGFSAGGEDPKEEGMTV